MTNFQIITERSLINGAADAWKAQYFREGAWSEVAVGNSSTIYRKLRKLPADASTADVAKIIGNDSWTDLECASCERKVKAVARFEQFEQTVDVCQECIQAALAALDATHRRTA